MPDAFASSYLPETLKRAIADSRAGLSLPARRGQAETQDAVLLLGDIKGSTGIIERAGRQGRVALERLTDNLRSLYADFVTLIYRYGGDVLFITGDAFLCLWPKADAADSAELAAASAALAIQQDLADRHDGSGYRLQFRIGVASGELTSAYVGGVQDRWELVLSGPALETVSAAERDVEAGRVLVNDRCYRALDGRLPGQQLPIGWLLDPVSPPEPELPETPRVLLPADLLAPYLPETILLRTDSKQQLLAEFRSVTVLMADLPAVDLRDAASVEQLDRCVGDFQSAMHQFEGSIRVDVDSKGFMLLGVFGLPPKAHEDDATRAIRAAESLRAAYLERGLPVSVGIATGPALCTPLGGERRREYMVRSEVINRAARLMQASGSEIACDASTSRVAARDYEFESLPGHLMKGMADLVDVLRPAGSRRSSVPTAMQVGREAEAARLHGALEELTDRGQGSTWWVEGDAGLGKSTMLASLAASARTLDARLLWARADAIERTRALHAWRPVVSELTGVGDDMDSATRGRRLTAALSDLDGFAGFEPLLADVLGVAAAETEQTERMDGDVRADNTRRLIYNLLCQAASVAPLVLLVEDAHWLDSQSAQLLQDLHGDAQRWLLAVSSRPLDQPLLADDKLQGIVLGPLAHPQVEQMLKYRLGVAEVPASLCELLLEHSAGNPFFIEQIISSLIDDGALSAANGQCLVNTETISVPSTLEAVVLSRLDRLPEEVQWIAKAASIVGRQLSEDALRSVVEALGLRTDLDGGIATLRSAGLFDTADRSVGASAELQFCHVTSRDVTYSTLPGDLRRAGHAAVASWMSSDATASQNPDLLSHHWLEAGELEKALDAAELAGEIALRVGSFPEALLHFDRVLDLAQRSNIDLQSTRAMLWQKGVGTAHYFLGHTETCRKALERVVGAFDQQVPESPLRLMLPLLGSVARQLRHRPSPIGRNLTGERKQVLDATVDSYKMLAQVYFLEGAGAAHLLYLPLRGLVVGDAAGASPALAATLINMSFMTQLMGLAKASERYAERAKAMAEAGGQLTAAPYVWHINALRLAQRARWEDALASNAEAERWAAELGDYTLAPDASAVRAAVSMCLGDLSAATDAVTTAKQVARQRGHELFYCWAVLDEALLAMARLDLPAAQALLNEALAIETPASDLGSVLDKASTTAQLRFAQRRFDEAREAAEIVCAQLQGKPPTSYYTAEFLANAVSVLVDIACQAPPDTALRKRCSSELKTLRKLSATFLNVEPRSLLLEGRLARLAGRDGQALFQRSLERAEALGMRLDQALALIELGTGGEADPAARERAAELLQELGRQAQAAQLAEPIERA